MKKVSDTRTVTSIVRRNLILSLGFGVLMGLVFPLYAELFAEFPDATNKELFSAGCILAGILVGLISFLISKVTVVRIVGKVADEMQSVAKGDSTIAHRLSIQSNDSIGALVTWYNAIVDRLSGISRDVGESCRTTSGVGAELSAASSRASECLGTVQDLAETLKCRVHALRESIEGCAERLQSIRMTGTGFAERAADQQSMVAAGSERVAAIMETMADLARGVAAEKTKAFDLMKMIADTEDALAGTQTEMGVAGDRMRALQGRIGAISDIAARINVLSMNASIQAARAGEAGRGFAVIAGDIRGLAETTNRHAEEIADDISQAVEKIACVEQLSSRTRAIFAAETEKIEAVSAYLSGIAENGARLASESGRVLEDMNRVQDAYAAFAGDSTSILESSEGIGSSMSVMAQASDAALSVLGEIDRARAGVQEVVADLSEAGVRLHASTGALQANIARF